MKAASFLLVVLLPMCANARPIVAWRVEKLMQESDLVVIARVESVNDFDGMIELPLFQDFLVAQVTTFQVSGVLKGEIDCETLELVHCRLGDLGGGTLWDWPTLAYFESEGHTIRIESGEGAGLLVQESQPSYLMFLKRRDDGRYEPVAGQVDSATSFLKVTSAFGL